ncbi:MAG: hypothetical protein U0797_18495 [Gemmataceae bacterium]
MTASRKLFLPGVRDKLARPSIVSLLIVTASTVTRKAICKFAPNVPVKGLLALASSAVGATTTPARDWPWTVTDL